ncbi:MAG: hypothetical protein AAB903_03370 [Patescibacteria group bacterium]
MPTEDTDVIKLAFQGAVSLMGTESVLPSQFFDNSGHGARALGERGLALAVLEDALKTYQKYVFVKDPVGRVIFDEADIWIFSRDRSWPFSFLNLCEALEINPSYVRRVLRQWLERSTTSQFRGGTG